MNRPDLQGFKATVQVIAAIAAVYVNFLIFAQFAFLKALETGVGKDAVNPIMAVMGVSGILGSLFTAVKLKRTPTFKLLRIGFLLCAVTAAATPWASGAAFFYILAAGVGAGTALTTVALATGLPLRAGGPHFGLIVAMGTGLGYFICNLPFVFESGTTVQCIVAAGASLLGVLFSGLPESSDHQVCPKIAPREVQGRGFAMVLLVFLALIWLDSACFYIIQQTESLKDVTWSGASRTQLNGVIHLFAAVGAGMLLDRGRYRLIGPTAFLLLTMGALLLRSPETAHSASVFYVTGVSLYSVYLVAFPGMATESEGTIPIRLRAGAIYAVAGWFGSAMGIGMAKDLNGIPIAFLVAAGTAIGFTLIGHRRFNLTKVLRRLATHSAPGAVITLIATAIIFAGFQPHADARASTTTAVERGKRVYESEGCIHCHSQYIRPDTLDEERWGPIGGNVAARAQRPRLPGNRRQGPDLTNVGNRRSSAWQRLHLKDPRRFEPNSSMPSFAHLFRDDRGEDLVAYLQSLGSDTIKDRMTTVLHYRPDPMSDPIPIKEAATLFDTKCGMCHGGPGRGEGARLAGLDQTPGDLATKPFRFVVGPNPNRALARTIKFGIPGTDMPGHETLSDAEIQGLVRFIRLMRGPDPDEAEFHHGLHAGLN